MKVVVAFLLFCIITKAHAQFGRRNLPIGMYPQPNCFSHCFLADNTDRFSVEMYIQCVNAYVDCINTHTENSREDILRIRKSSDEAQEDARQLVSEAKRKIQHGF